MVVAALLGGVGADAAGLKGEKVKIVPATPVERQWKHWGNKMGVEYYGTYDHISSNRTYIRDPWGELMEIPLFYCSPPDLSYMLNRNAKLPKTVTDYKIEDGDNHKLIDVKVDELPLGEVKYLENHGELGGGFHSLNYPPVVEMIKGRKGIKFAISASTHIQVKYQALSSDFTVSDRL